jgi:hypothetical protein
MDCAASKVYTFLSYSSPLLPLDVSVIQPHSVLPLDVSVIQKTVLPMDMSVLQQPFAASGGVYSAADCAVSERICSTAALATSGGVSVLLQDVLSLCFFWRYLFYCSLGCPCSLSLQRSILSLDKSSRRCLPTAAVEHIVHSCKTDTSKGSRGFCRRHVKRQLRLL